MHDTIHKSTRVSGISIIGVYMYLVDRIDVYWSTYIIRCYGNSYCIILDYSGWLESMNVINGRMWILTIQC